MGMHVACAGDNMGAGLIRTHQWRMNRHGGVRLGRAWVPGDDVEILFRC